ncbi:MAG: fumarylacetoacetate hydrolase family protein [bacterium]|nr:fumarylacetoacetate hydrolase family protein [bacterium]
MRICSFNYNGKDQAGVLVGEKIVAIEVINNAFGKTFPLELSRIIKETRFKELKATMSNGFPVEKGDDKGVPVQEALFKAPYQDPSKIWGIGLNYRDHAVDLNALLPEDEPASFMKPSTTIIGNGDNICLPSQSKRVTGEAEIGVIIGKECKDVNVEDVRDVILGYTTIVDMTAEDILKRNPRFLTRSKSFDTFFSFGPWIVSEDEVNDVNELEITTFINGEVHRSNKVGNMTFPPHELVAFHSRVMTFKPGDIISCGTPGAVVIRPGDLIGCEVTTIGRLENPVTDR